MNNYENNIYGLSIFYILIEAGSRIFAPIPYLYIAIEKINPWEFPRILVILSKIKGQENFVAAQSSFEIIRKMFNYCKGAGCLTQCKAAIG